LAVAEVPGETVVVVHSLVCFATVNSDLRVTPLNTRETNQLASLFHANVGLTVAKVSH
jgi:hypothetical protein